MADTDRISNLPDEVLFHILSFLPTEDVFATSLVSNRFRPLWLSVTTLDFDEYRFTPPGTRSLVRSPPSSFIKFISAAILACGIHQPIKKLRLWLSLPALDLIQPPSSFIQSIHAAILRRSIHQPIKTLHLKGKYATFTDHIQTWLTAATVRNVESLQIQCCTMQGLILPCSILSSTNLVVLKMQCTKFKDFSSVELPSLKALHLNGVYFFNAQHLMELLNGCPNLETLEAHQISFDYIDPSSKGKGKLKPLSKLVRADLSFMRMRILRAYNIDEFVREFCHDADIPIFPNLFQFRLILGGRFVKLEAVLYLLNHCPQLQTFVLGNDRI
ncbi:F-box/FBD/LRR-repeat protein At2g04230-like [Lotus japonicus]|uniref:F-box/FBD/LRR-repeat protein At2g04230-like n=1 Tax=Lotus japonicus TaxID=34305 RepID=UPI00258DE819|nr:F-box/FBD/LRR-repeat protein At2g04230-like [Lotus japonicus]